MTDGVKFGKNGEWVKAHQLQVQYHDLTDAADLETWRGMSYQTVLSASGGRRPARSFIRSRTR